MQLLNNVSLKDYTNYKIGGVAPRFYIIESVEDLNQVPMRDIYNAYILGGGTNILVSDRDLQKAVLKIDIKGNSLDTETLILSVGSGAILNELTEDLAKRGYDGLSGLDGIPGTVGGAIVMNAGASHGNISDNLIDVTIMDRKTKEIRSILRKDCKFGFRTSIFQGGTYIILSARFQLKEGNRGALLRLHDEIIEYRRKNYPLDFPSAGCWFKRDWGGKDVIHKIGMVGASKGKAVVSPMFPAFILNTGGATAEDVYSLVKDIQDKALEEGEDMPCEVEIWGSI